LNHYLLFSTYYFFLYQCCTIPNDLNFLKYVANLPWQMNSKKHHHFGHFSIQMRACEVQLPNFLQSQKNDFCHFKRWYLAMHMVEISENFPKYFQVSILQDPMVTCIQYSYGPLRVNVGIDIAFLMYQWWAFHKFGAFTSLCHCNWNFISDTSRIQNIWIKTDCVLISFIRSYLKLLQSIQPYSKSSSTFQIMLLFYHGYLRSLNV